MTKIRDVEFGSLLFYVEKGTLRSEGRSGDPRIQLLLQRFKPVERVRLLLDEIAHAFSNSDFSPALLRALVRVSNHPRAPKTVVWDESIAAHVTEHPPLPWIDAVVEQNLIDAVIEIGGDREVEESRAPRNMKWGPASLAANALFLFKTLHRLGDLDIDEHERATYEETVEHFEHTKDIKPSSLVAPPPAKDGASAAEEDVPGERLFGTPRSLQEMDYAANLRPCTSCGDRSLLDWRTGGNFDVALVSSECPGCSARRCYVFNLDPDVDLAEVESPELELGGSEPSTVIAPYEFQTEIDRLATSISSPYSLGGDAADQMWKRIERVQVALNELAKFIPDDAAAMPESAARTELERQDLRTRPERYTRAWIDESRDRYAELVKPPNT